MQRSSGGRPHRCQRSHCPQKKGSLRRRGADSPASLVNNSRTMLSVRISAEGLVEAAASPPSPPRSTQHTTEDDARFLIQVKETAPERRKLTIPFIGVICVVTRWRDAANREQRLRLVWTQTLHWGAVLLAMRLIFVTDVTRMMNADASPLPH
jgi:hypothetical protein